MDSITFIDEASNIDPDYRPQLDTIGMLPYECRLLPEDPSVRQLPKAYRGSITKSILDARPPAHA